MTAAYSADAAHAAARDTARQAARREAEHDADWDSWVDEALANAGDHSLELAEHTGRAMRLIDKEDR